MRDCSGIRKGAKGKKEGRQWGMASSGEIRASVPRPAPRPAARPADLGDGLLEAIWDILQAWTGDCLNLLGLVSKAGIKPFCSTKAFH